MSYDILVVEDDMAIRQGVVDSLEYEGYNVFEADNGKTGLDMALAGSYDLLLLDLVLPGRSGFEILQNVREASLTQAVIILTARGEENDRIRGLKMGADDYVVKPFSVGELLARVQAVLRRIPERPQDVREIPFVHGKIDIARSEIIFNDGETAPISEKEAQLLSYLASHSERAISRQEILQRVWQLDGNISTRTIDMHIARLREKLRDDGKIGIISTVRGKGYMFSGEKP